MIKITSKIRFKSQKNRMNKIGDIKNAINLFKKRNNKNLFFLLKNRYGWMKKFIKDTDKGLEVGAGAGFSKDFISCSNFKISDLASFEHLDHKNIDAQDTNFEKNSYDFVIASNMIHHVPFPIKFLDEMYKILKPGGKLLYTTCSILPAENELCVAAFSDITNDATALTLPGKLGLPTVHGRQRLPGLHSGDGFFYALFQKGEI